MHLRVDFAVINVIKQNIASTGYCNRFNSVKGLVGFPEAEAGIWSEWSGVDEVEIGKWVVRATLAGEFWVFWGVN